MNKPNFEKQFEKEDELVMRVNDYMQRKSEEIIDDPQFIKKNNIETITEENNENNTDNNNQPEENAENNQINEEGISGN